MPSHDPAEPSRHDGPATPAESAATSEAPGASLPEPLSARLRSSLWLRTAHRGAPTVAPGNSRAAIAAALELPVDLVEVDLHATRDGRLVLWHDDDLHGTKIASASLAELRRIDVGDGGRIIELGEAMEMAKGRAGLMIDLKADGLAEGIARELRAHDFGPAVVCGDYRESLERLKSLAPRAGISLTLDLGWRLRYRMPLGARIQAHAVTVNHRLLSRRFIDRLHEQGLAVLAWTVDEPRRMRDLLARGVDGLTSNRPDLLVQLDSRRPTAPR